MYIYLLMAISDVLLAAGFVFQKKFQLIKGNDIISGLLFLSLTGFLKALIYLGLNKFCIEFTMYSFIMSLIQSFCSITYTILSFRVLKYGSLSIYTLFLLTGGMTLPYLYGIFFMGEQATTLRIIGIIVIISSIVFSNSDFKNTSKQAIILCIFIFFLNGFTSIVSKIHQTEVIHETISTNAFAFWTSIPRFAVCLPIYFILVAKKKPDFKEIFNFKDLKRILPIALGEAVTGGISYTLQLVGAVNIPATVLYPVITGGGIVMSTLAGIIALHEKPTKRQIIGITACFIGTCLFLGSLSIVGVYRKKGEMVIELFSHHFLMREHV